MTPMTPHWVQPSHPDLIEIFRSPNDFTSYAISKVDLPEGAVLTPLTGATVVDTASYASYQVTADTHMEFNSDLLYCDHSCDPNLECDVDRCEMRVAKNKSIKVGDRLTWFYPSTEWEMIQEFACRCGAASCQGWIAGASKLSAEELRGYWLNKHIAAMVEARDATGTPAGSSNSSEK